MRTLLLLSILAAPAPVLCADTQPTGFFSNMHYVGQTGDVIGDEVFIVYSREGYFAYVQCAEGSPGLPVIVPVKLKGLDVEFSIPEKSGSQCSGATFSGRVSKTELSGKWRYPNVSHDAVLKRRRSYWQ